MVGIKGYKFKTLHDLELDNEYVLKLSRNIKKGQKISILSDTMLKLCFKMKIGLSTQLSFYHIS